MKNNMFVISAILFMALICLPQAGHGQWIKQIIDKDSDGPTVFVVIDFDNDNDLDLVATFYLEPLVAWYENKNGNPVQWQQHMIDNTLSTPHEASVSDLDGDGDLDVVVAESVDHAIVWFENLGGLPLTWTKHTIDGQLSWAAWLTVEDIDGDGDPDVAASSYYNDLCFWYENLGDTPLKWHKYSFGANGGGFLRFVDMDGDSALDMVTCANGNVFWYKNNLPDTNWTINIIDNTLSQTRQIRVADMDNDADTDIVITTGGKNIYWYENMGEMPIQWNRNLINDNLNVSAGLDLADIDGDSLLDAVTADYNGNKVVWYRNNLSNTKWTQNFIDSNLQGATYVLTHDFDFDGNPDVFAEGQSSDQLVWYRNMVNQAYGKSLQCQSSYIPLSGETLNLSANIYIPSGHEALVYAVINDTLNGFTDSLQLFDDYNGRVNDGIWGNQMDFKPQNETIYSLGISIWDNTTNTHFYKPDLSSFTSLGPLKMAEKPVIYGDYSQNTHNFQIVLSNAGIFADAVNITAKISTNDYRVWEINTDNTTFADLAPGTIDTCDKDLIFSYNEGYFPDDTKTNPILFNVKIFSNGIHYWSDSFKFSTDETVPDSPINLKAELDNTNSTVTLSWSPCDAADLDTYKIYRSTINNADSAKYLNSVPGVDTSYTDYSATGPVNCYWVTAVDFAGNESAFSNSIVVGINDLHKSVPDHFFLCQNYPNPFNPKTVIRYALPVTSHLELSIYNLLGQKVATLVNKKQPAGMYSVQWDASGFASGVYLYKLETGNGYRKVKKLVLLK